ncbi:hypothetical protein QR680_001500 [Steinernema hermaphroditum]|uniref:Uncharacterized protein n=1 Tax=Steinernema hermaphroditum TaxID=289476 RepID=A0AA39LG20_9BILA|nr:hypothetical protein QR680_001500 [Steinernema hermaphroditum]
MQVKKLLLLTLYFVSIVSFPLPLRYVAFSFLVLAALLFLWSGVYCQMTNCTLTRSETNRNYGQIFPMITSFTLIFLSSAWFISNACYMHNEFKHDYSCLEMPTAVGCSMLAGVCAVIELHYSIDYSELHWTDKWTFAAADSTTLVFIHALIAFCLN